MPLYPKASYPKIVLMVRSSHDWFNGRSEVLDCQYTPVRNMHALIKGWRLFFRMDYFEFRLRLREIARSTFIGNNFDAIFYWFNWDVFEHFDENTWIVPIDDDDWISPYLVKGIRRVLEEVPQKTGLLRWKAFHIDECGKVLLKHRDTYLSCAYSLKMPCDFRFPLYHEAMIKGESKRRPYDIQEYLAVKVSNLASLSFYFLTRPCMTDILKIAQDRKLVKKDLLPSEFHSPVDQYNKILNELYDSCRV